MAPAFRINRCALPEWCVLWEIAIGGKSGLDRRVSMELRLGAHLPANQTEFVAMEVLLSCCECLNLNVGRLIGYSGQQMHLTQLRLPVHSMGRRLVSRHSTDTGDAIESAVTTVWSSIPKEVPDWMFSAIR